LKANGNTCSERVLNYAFDFHRATQPIDAIYYMSDGKPDHSTKYLLEQVRVLNTNSPNTTSLTDSKRLSINTISFCCQDADANEFLKRLAHDNNGRYHRSTNNSRDLHLFVHRLQEDKTYTLELDETALPELDSDDLKRLLREIVKTRLYLRQAITFRSIYNQQHESGHDHQQSVLVGPARVPMSEPWLNRSASTVLT
jgi:hypothetical protein